MNIENYLANYSNETIYYCPNPGNAGDALIALGAYQLFDKLDINYKIARIGDDLSNRIVFYGGGGQLVNLYNGYAINFLKRHKDTVKKLVILPSTIDLDQDILRSFDDRVDIICREKISYNYVRSIHDPAKTFISDDLAFSLDITKLFEHKFEKFVKSIFLLKNVYHYLKFTYNKIVLLSSKSRILNSFRTDSEKTNFQLPDDNYDVASQFGALVFNENLSTIIGYYLINFLNTFEVINTNRLHIAISSAIMGKKVNFYPNIYWKNKAVYDYSMKTRYPNVRWSDN